MSRNSINTNSRDTSNEIKKLYDKTFKKKKRLSKIDTDSTTILKLKEYEKKKKEKILEARKRIKEENRKKADKRAKSRQFIKNTLKSKNREKIYGKKEAMFQSTKFPKKIYPEKKQGKKLTIKSSRGYKKRKSLIESQKQKKLKEKLKKKYIKEYKKNTKIPEVIDVNKDWEEKNKEMVNDQFGFDMGGLSSKLNTYKSKEKDKGDDNENNMLSEYNIKAIKNNINDLEKNFLYRNTIIKEKNKRERRPTYLENVKEMEKVFIFDKKIGEKEDNEFYENIDKFLPHEMRRKSNLMKNDDFSNDNISDMKFDNKFGNKLKNDDDDEFNEINKMKKSIIAKSEFIEDDSIDEFNHNNEKVKSVQNNNDLNFEDLDTFVQDKEIGDDKNFNDGKSLTSEKRLEMEQDVIKRRIEKEKEEAEKKQLLENQLGLIMASSNQNVPNYNEENQNFDESENSGQNSDIFLKIDSNEFIKNNELNKKNNNKGGYNPFYENFLDPTLGKKENHPSNELTYIPQIYVDQKPDSQISNSKKEINVKKILKKEKNKKFSQKKNPTKKKVDKRLEKLFVDDIIEDDELDNDTIEGTPYQSLLESDSIKVIVSMINKEKDENDHSRNNMKNHNNMKNGNILKNKNDLKDENDFNDLKKGNGFNDFKYGNKYDFGKKKKRGRNYVDIHLGHYKQYVK